MTYNTDTGVVGTVSHPWSNIVHLKLQSGLLKSVEGSENANFSMS